MYIALVFTEQDSDWIKKYHLQVIGMHFMNPPPIMKLVEIVRGADTSDNTFYATKALAERWPEYLLLWNNSTFHSSYVLPSTFSCQIHLNNCLLHFEFALEVNANQVPFRPSLHPARAFFVMLSSDLTFIFVSIAINSAAGLARQWYALKIFQVSL